MRILKGRMFGVGAVLIICLYTLTMAQNTEGVHQSNESVTSSISDQNKFEILYDSLRDISDTYYQDVMKTLAFLIIAIGWFVTSDKSRNFFRKNNVPRISALAAVALLCVIHVRFALQTFDNSQELNALLDALNYVGAEFYTGHTIAGMDLYANLVQNVALFAVLFTIIFSLRSKPVSE